MAFTRLDSHIADNVGIDAHHVANFYPAVGVSPADAHLDYALVAVLRQEVREVRRKVEHAHPAHGDIETVVYGLRRSGRHHSGYLRENRVEFLLRGKYDKRPVHAGLPIPAVRGFRG